MNNRINVKNPCRFPSQYRLGNRQGCLLYSMGVRVAIYLMLQAELVVWQSRRPF